MSWKRVFLTSKRAIVYRLWRYDDILISERKFASIFSEKNFIPYNLLISEKKCLPNKNKYGSLLFIVKKVSSEKNPKSGRFQKDRPHISMIYFCSTFFSITTRKVSQIYKQNPSKHISEAARKHISNVAFEEALFAGELNSKNSKNNSVLLLYAIIVDYSTHRAWQAHPHISKSKKKKYNKLSATGGRKTTLKAFSSAQNYV